MIPEIAIAIHYASIVFIYVMMWKACKKRHKWGS